MTAHVRSTPHTSALPASQTAPVAEFRCLFTHDVRRKQKRWQDGYLKFHTFNNRVMVCDQARNHVGDTYWKDSNELQEGDELSLDKGVLVEVAEAMGITQTDLAPLFERKTKEHTKEPPARPTPSVTTRPFQRPSTVAPNNAARTGTQLRHKSLNTLLGTPKGPAGKAQPMKSPYEARKEQEQENEMAEERAPKRQKTAQRPGGWRASSPVQEDSPPAKATPLWARTADARNHRPPQARMPPVSRVITISSESDHIPVISSNVTLPSTPAKVVKPATRPTVTSAPTIQSSIFNEPLPVETPKPPPRKIRLPKPKPVETPKRPAPTSSPPVSASNRLTNVDFAVQPVRKLQKEPSPKPSPPQRPKGKPLRLSTGVKRGTLLCQSISRPVSRGGSEPKASGSRPNVATSSRLASKEPPSPTAQDFTKNDASAKRASNAKPSRPLKDSRRASNAEAAGAEKSGKVNRVADEPSEDIFDDPELIHGLMDQQLLVLSSTAKPPEKELAPPQKAPKTTVTKSKAGQTAKVRKAAEVEEAEATSIELQPPVTKPTAKGSQTAKKTKAKPQPVHPASPPRVSIFEPPAPPSRNISPAHSNASRPPSRTSSKSPTKSLLSTGGFRKKTKGIAKESAATSTTTMPTPVPRNISVPLPPHPLTAGKKAPLMSTTELASLLQTNTKRARKADPIGDPTHATGKSPARKIRRVRRENDAPIPSTAQDWEQRNLLKTSSDLTDVGVGVEVEVEVEEPKKKVSALAALTKRTDPRKKFQRTKSLGVETGGGGVEVEVAVDLLSPVLDKDVGPWSTEASDLFDWRPPTRGAGT